MASVAYSRIHGQISTEKEFLCVLSYVCLVCSETTSSIRSDVYRLVKDMKCQTSN